MNYHNITHDDMLNGDGIRVVLWVSGCEHHCEGCQNPMTWNPDDGLDMTTKELEEIYNDLYKPYVAGITFSGGDPLHPANYSCVKLLCKDIKAKFPDKTIWLYSGYDWEDVKNDLIMTYIDVFVDGKFIQALADKNYHWAGSTNQRVIDVQRSLKEERVILHESNEEGWDSGSIQFTENCQCSS